MQPQLHAMRAIAFFVLFLFSANAYSQPGIEQFLDSTVAHLKTQGRIDKSDVQVFSLLENFYTEALQSEQGELSATTAQKINTYVGDTKTGNRHLLILFLMYQQHISETAAQGKRPNVDFQVSCINLLEKEMLAVYQKVPTIVYIYKAEALQSAGRYDEARALVAASLKKDPASIPLKVYRYLDTKEEAIKNDLVKNHSAHWMVQQFRIK
ncbi:MAG: hypothetical protein ACO1NX_03845 [Chitinophagaceae bacterium]